MIKIEINCEPHEYDAHIRALGFLRNPVATLGEAPRVLATIPASALKTAEALSTFNDELASLVDPGPSAFATEMEAHERPSDLAAPPQDPNAKRVPGQPVPGRKRRTKEEMEEDYAYLKKHGSLPGGVAAFSQSAEPPAAISTGEARVDPQDEADEAAETAARATGKPTMEDLRRMVAKWTEKVGSAAAIKDLRSIIGCAMIELPEAEIGAAITRVEAAINGSVVLGVPNLGGQPPAPEEAEIIETPKSTKEEVISAIMAYGKLYDGSVDPNVMPMTKEDLPKIFGKLFGNGVTGIGSMPVKSPEAFGQIFTAISAATRDNPFKRQVHA